MKTFIALFSVLLTQSALSSEGRFIVWGNSESLLSKLKLHHLTWVRSLTHRKALVVFGDERDVEAMALKDHLQYEKDSVYHLMGRRVFVSRRPGGMQFPQVVPWGISKVKALQAHSSGFRGEGTLVCISDTGIDLTHPDLAGNIIDNFNAINARKSANDDHGHGSHVAGTVAAVDNAIGVVGVAPRAKLIAVKALNKSGMGNASDLAESIDACRVRKAHVINMSWGSSSPSTIIHEALADAFAAGILLVAASGNSSGPVMYPAAFPEVVAISAVDSNDLLASFSNFGTKIENSAPGVQVYSTFKGGGYATYSGTSMAAPHVVGVAALVRAAKGKVAREDLLGVDIGLPWSEQGSRGRIDAVLSLSY